MLFSSFTFIFSFVGVLALYQALARFQRLRLWLLLVASYGFYAYWDPRFLILIFLSTAVDYVVAGRLRQSPQPMRLLLFSIFVNLGFLGIFKYFDFFQRSLEELLRHLSISYHPLLLGIMVPVGISFYTFQSMAYTIDVYRGHTEPCRDPLLFALFVAYFPQLVAGPIERSRQLLPQLSNLRSLRTETLTSGFILMTLGFFKKCVLGDLAGYYLVEPYFDSPSNGVELWVATLGFTVQIYGDFSGYTDIARGVSRCFGVELSKNFLAPYFASSITEFWRRWHVTLSAWFRDYLYIPLGGNRKGALRTYFNLSATMLLCGLWHGASATFLLWGAYHGILLIAHRSLGREGKPDSLPKVIFTFLLTCYGWMLFRLDDAGKLWRYTELLVRPQAAGVDSLLLLRWLSTLAVLYLGIAFFHWLERQDEQFEELFSPAVAGAVIALLWVIILSLGSLAEPLPFIYFQF